MCIKEEPLPNIKNLLPSIGVMQTENNAPEISYFRETGKNAKRGQYHCAPLEEITTLPPLTLPIYSAYCGILLCNLSSISKAQELLKLQESTRTDSENTEAAKQ